MQISRGSLIDALHRIGQNPAARNIMLEALIEIERHFEKIDFDPRELIVGPVVDSLFTEEMILEKSLRSGTKFSARYTSKIIRDFLLAGKDPEFVWEPQTSKAMLLLAEGAKNVLIGGAYIGDHAVLVAQALTQSGQVHCFEPSEASIELLRTNVHRNGLANVKINQMGLWGKDERLVLTGDDSHASPKKADGEEGSFAATTIDSYCAGMGIEQLDLIQLDIEGGELEALQGACKVMACSKDASPTIIFEIHGSYTDWSQGLENTDVVKLVASYGYEVFAIRDYNSNEPMDGMPVELIPISTAYIDGPPHGFNLLAIRDRSTIETSGFSVVEGVSPKLLKHRDPRMHAPT